MTLEKCLICGQEAPRDSEFQSVSLLERQLNAVFVLRELLEVPEIYLRNWLLRSDGDNPATWITICKGRCQEIVENAQTAYREMQAARTKIRAYQKEIRDKIRLSSHMPNHHHEDYKTEILQTAQEVVRKRNIPETEDFAAGDRMADQLLEIRQEILNQPKPIPNFIVQKLELESSSESLDEMEIVDDFADTKEQVAKIANAIFPCDLCDKSYDSFLRLTKHKSNCHVPKPIKSCPHCDYTTDHSNYTLNRHIRIMHEKSQIWICDICQKKSNEPRHLQYHQALHHHKCSVKDCGKVCESQQHLRDHQVNCHGKEVDVFQCPECGLLCRFRSLLKDHVQIAHKKAEANHLCSYCRMAYVTRKQLTKHIYKAHKAKNRKITDKNDLILGI